MHGNRHPNTGILSPVIASAEELVYDQNWNLKYLIETAGSMTRTGNSRAALKMGKSMTRVGN